MNFDEFRHMIEAEYDRLCAALGLTPVPLDIYPVNERAPSTVRTPHGTPLANSTPGYRRGLMLLPSYPDQVEEWSEAPEFPPELPWDKGASHWPIWRIELWHETCHQIQDIRLGHWNPQDGRNGHGPGWQEAAGVMAETYGTDAETLLRVIYY